MDIPKRAVKLSSSVSVGWNAYELTVGGDFTKTLVKATETWFAEKAEGAKAEEIIAAAITEVLPVSDETVHYSLELRTKLADAINRRVMRLQPRRGGGGGSSSSASRREPKPKLLADKPMVRARPEFEVTRVALTALVARRKEIPNSFGNVLAACSVEVMPETYRRGVLMEKWAISLPEDSCYRNRILGKLGGIASLGRGLANYLTDDDLNVALHTATSYRIVAAVGSLWASICALAGIPDTTVAHSFFSTLPECAEDALADDVFVRSKQQQTLEDASVLNY